MSYKVKGLLKMLLLAYGVSAIMLIILAFILFQFRPGSGFIGGAVIVTYIFSTLFGGYLLGRRVKDKRFIWGIGFGALYFVVLFLISLIFHKGNIAEISSAVTAYRKSVV